jgi:cation diffusion facilitator family transporter
MRGPRARRRMPAMHSHDLSEWRHEHVFDSGNAAAERSTRWVMWITLAMMAVEIAAGWFYNSMALLADGFHMSSHAVAIGLSAYAYATARRHANDPRYAFGTWKIEVLGGFASAVFLLVVVALMAWGSVERLIKPEPIHYPEAMAIAVLGLVVNLVCALILGQAHDHGHHHGHDHAHHHAHGHGHDHGHHHHDLNLKSAYLHVIADAATSVAAIAALAGGWWLGWAWLDPVMGLVGAVLVAVWARGLIAETSRVLLDREMDHPVVDEIREVIAERGTATHTLIADLHVWRVGRATYACAMSLVTHDAALTPREVRDWLSVHEEIVHATIEIHRCPDEH